MKQYWQSLQQREQRVLIGGGAALVLLVFYQFIIDPLIQGIEQKQESVAYQRSVVNWMEQAAAQVRTRQTQSPERSTPPGDASVMSLVDASARKFGLADALKQISPAGERVRVQLESAGFDRLLRWLDELSREYGITVDTLSVERLPESGSVNATLLLKSQG